MDMFSIASDENICGRPPLTLMLYICGNCAEGNWMSAASGITAERNSTVPLSRNVTGYSAIELVVRRFGAPPFADMT